MGGGKLPLKRSAVLRSAVAGTSVAVLYVRSVICVGATWWSFSKEVDMFSHRRVHQFKYIEPMVIGFWSVVVLFMTCKVGPTPQFITVGFNMRPWTQYMLDDLSSTHVPLVTINGLMNRGVPPPDFYHVSSTHCFSLFFLHPLFFIILPPPPGFYYFSSTPVFTILHPPPVFKKNVNNIFSILPSSSYCF